MSPRELGVGNWNVKPSFSWHMLMFSFFAFHFRPVFVIKKELFEKEKNIENIPVTKLLDRWLNHVQRRTCLCRKMLGVNYIKTAMFANITFNNGHFSLIWRRAITRKRVIQNLFIWNWVIQYLLQTMHAKFGISRRKILQPYCVSCFEPALLRRARPDRLVLRTLQFHAPEFFFPS